MRELRADPTPSGYCGPITKEKFTLAPVLRILPSAACRKPGSVVTLLSNLEFTVKLVATSHASPTSQLPTPTFAWFLQDLIPKQSGSWGQFPVLFKLGFMQASHFFQTCARIAEMRRIHRSDVIEN